jgi:crotonobetainyl-CoA:carnitine CoA-transferase CaiB-like acyl-CoA transferase
MQFAQWAPHGAYPCRGKDEWIAIAVQNDAQWEALAVAIGSPDWTRAPLFKSAEDRKTNEEELDRMMSEFTKGQDRYDLMMRLQQHGIAATAVQTAADRCERDPQLKERDYFVKLPHSEIGTWPVEGFPARFDKIPADVGGLPGRGAPMMGEDNDYVYGEILGLKPEDIATLKEELII